jgi:carbonic anhydrase
VPTTAAPTQALEALIAGNRRYAAAGQTHPRQTSDYRFTLLEGQNPFAAILSCSDSRVPSELIFDQGLGDLFIVRTAGHVINDIVLGSVEFAVHALKVPLVLVLAHTQCGAVASAVSDQPVPGHIGHVIKHLRVAVESVRGQQGDLVEHAIVANARLCAAYILESSPLIRQLVEQDRVHVVAACYDLATGYVEILR